MQNFVFHNPTEIVFGKGTIAGLASRVPQDVPILLVYGRGSIQSNGVYDQVRRALGKRARVDFGGIEPNPRYETAMRAVERVREHKIGFLLSVGGGSVLDACKFIAAAARFEGQDPWDILSRHAPVHAALPIGAVLTLPATGSESNGNAVISRDSTQEKLAFSSRAVYPVFSILDPETTFSLPPKQVRNGIVDAMVHVFEQYATYPAAAPLHDRLAEGILTTLVEVGPKTLAAPQDYDARAAFMWCATLALNGLVGCGVPNDWATHEIGHDLTALYGIDHAESLAVVLPGVWKLCADQKRDKLAQYAERVFGASGVEGAIEATEQFFLSLGMPVRLADHGIDAQEAAAKITERFRARRARLGEHRRIDADAVGEILRMRA
ncbi:MAG: iron-containing alcohol dehydrogenase [Polyangiaceae bacterium]|nr:iron-containing alcohol dehydrogenase [Polyangiaceae bacterium]